MRQFPQGGILGKAQGLFRWVRGMRIPLHAAYAGYFIILAMFPALLLILASLRYTDLDVGDLMTFIGDLLPEALLDAAEEVVFGAYQSLSGTVVGVAAVTALWSSSKGIYGLLRGLNAIYGVSEDRGYFYTRLISVGYTFLFFLILLLTLGLHVFGNGLIGLLTMVDHPLLIFLVDLIDLRFFLLLILQSLVFTLMFMALPNRRNGFRESLPGGILASSGWLIFSDLYSVYVGNVSRYASIFGSVYAVSLSMLWLYCCMSILFYGGALNRFLMEK